MSKRDVTEAMLAALRLRAEGDEELTAIADRMDGLAAIEDRARAVVAHNIECAEGVGMGASYDLGKLGEAVDDLDDAAGWCWTRDMAARLAKLERLEGLAQAVRFMMLGHHDMDDVRRCMERLWPGDFGGDDA